MTDTQKICSISKCTRPSKVRDLCTTHYSRAYADGSLEIKRSKPKPFEPRFWAKVDKRSEAECWPWLGSKSIDGYGKFYIAPKSRQAHRVSWEMFYSKTFPEGKVADHICNNPGCVNPKHVDPVDEIENIRNKKLQKNNTSGYRGVSYCVRSRKWFAQVTYIEDEITKHKTLGYYDAPEEAAKVVRAWRKKHWGLRDSCNI